MTRSLARRARTLAAVLTAVVAAMTLTASAITDHDCRTAADEPEPEPEPETETSATSPETDDRADDAGDEADGDRDDANGVFTAWILDCAAAGHY